jgi:hypothetical protein
MIERPHRPLIGADECVEKVPTAGGVTRRGQLARIDARWAARTTAPSMRRNGLAPRTTSSRAHTSKAPRRTPSTAVVWAADKLNLPSTKVTSHTQRADGLV